MNRIMSKSRAAKILLKPSQILPITRDSSSRLPLCALEKSVAQDSFFSKKAIDRKVVFLYYPSRATPPSFTSPKSQSGHEEYENSVALSANPSLGFPGLLAGCIRPA